MIGTWYVWVKTSSYYYFFLKISKYIENTMYYNVILTHIIIYNGVFMREKGSNASGPPLQFDNSLLIIPFQ